MATTTKLFATNGYYGHSGNKAYTTADANHLYVGKSSGTSDYRARMSFAALPGLAEIGSGRFRITKMVLYIRRNDGGPTAITVGCSSSSKWGAALAATASATIDDTTGWYAVDVTNLAEAVAGYTSKWYLHITGKTPRLRFSSTGSSYKPYLMVTWEHVAATITGDKDSARLGTDEVTFTITPEVSGETHTLTYSIGDSEETIVEYAGNAIAWTPPIELAAEIPNDDTATVEIHMTAYDSSGRVQRTELYYQTVSVPETLVPAIADIGAVLVNRLSGYGLAGRSMLDIAPVIDMNGTCGASIVSLSAQTTDGYSAQWSALTEEDPGLFTAASVRTGTLSEGICKVTVTVMDSRGRTVSAVSSFTVFAYSPPVITDFSVERYEPVYDENEEISDYIASDLGKNVRVNLSARVADVRPGDVPLNMIEWKIEGTNGILRDVRQGSGDTALAIIGDRTIFTDAIGEDETWTYTVTITDSAGSTAVQYSTVVPGHASFSLSPDKWGAAVGMIATGRKASPKFEVAEAYESHLYGGVWGANYRIDRCDKYAPLEITNANFAAYSDALAPRISRVGSQVYLDGFLTNTADLEAGFSESICTLPDWAIPAVDASAINQGSGESFFWVHVNASGNLQVSRYRKGAENVDAAAGRQFPLTLRWLAADAFIQTYSARAVLSGCSIDNAAASVTEGAAYVAKLKLDPGTELTYISITMGGADVSGYFENNLIHIPIVTGDIVITAIAEESAAAAVRVSYSNGALTFTEIVDGALETEYSDGLLTIARYSTATAAADGETIIIR